MKGRKSLPNNIKVLQGTAKKCRMKGVELAVVKNDYVPPAPAWFSITALSLYQDVTQELLNKGLIEKVDVSAVVAFCNQMGLHLELEEKLSKRGDRVDECEMPNGITVRRLCPEHRASMDALEKAMRIGAEFGFTPLSRQRLVYQIKHKDPTDDDFS